MIRCLISPPVFALAVFQGTALYSQAVRDTAPITNWAAPLIGSLRQKSIATRSLEVAF